MPDPHGLRARLLAGKPVADLTDSEMDELFEELVRLLESRTDPLCDEEREPSSRERANQDA